MDVSGALQSIFNIVVAIHDRIGSHKIGKADIRFEFARYETYLQHGERDLIELGLRSQLCHPAAERVTQLHSAIAEWLEANNFRLGGNIKLPRVFLEKKASSLKGHVDAIKEARDRLWDELQDEVRSDSSSDRFKEFY
jgi:hypothetical protein